MDSFCPKCGTTKGTFVKGFCQKCFLEDNPLIELPKRIQIEHCKRCGKVRIKGKWLEQNEKSIEAIIEANLKTKQIASPKTSIELKQLGDGTTIAIVKADGKTGEEKISVQAETLLVPKELTCNDCNLLGANYYEAVLQLRFSRKPNEMVFKKTLREIERIAASLQKSDSLSKITSVEKVRNGFNAAIGSKRAAKKIVEFFEKKHNAETKSSFTLAGVDASGRVRKRYTFLIRI